MPIQTWGFAPRVALPELSPGDYFTTYGNQWIALCMCVESNDDPLCLILDYEGHTGYQLPTPRRLYLSELSANRARIPAEHLVIRPRSDREARAFMAPVSTIASHGALAILPSGEPVILCRHHGTGNWSLETGAQISALAGAMIYPNWEIAVAEQPRIYTTLARFPEEEG